MQGSGVLARPLPSCWISAGSWLARVADAGLGNVTLAGVARVARIPSRRCRGHRNSDEGERFSSLWITHAHRPSAGVRSWHGGFSREAVARGAPFRRRPISCGGDDSITTADLGIDAVEVSAPVQSVELSSV